MHNESPRSPEMDDRYANDNRRYTNDAGRRRKCRGHGFDEIESTELVAAEFPASRSNDYRKHEREPAREPVREPAREQGREKGREQGREWQPRKVWTDGLPPMSIEQQLEGPRPNHMFYDDNGVRRSSHKLKDCRRFQLLAEATLRRRHSERDTQPYLGH